MTNEAEMFRALEEEQKRSEQEEAAQKRLETERKAREALRAQRLPIYQGIFAELKKLDPAARFEDGSHLKLFSQGLDLYVWLDITEERTHVSSWRSKPNGRLRVTTGSWGEKTSYPQRKDGNFKYEAIARDLYNCAYREAASRRAQRARMNNQTESDALRTKLGLSSYTSVINPSTTPEKPVFVKIDIQRAMTAEEAEKIIVALRDQFGIKFS